ncbi:MAG: creatininase family protein [Gemmatimonadota bacterium]|nr:creatininase family protein [Gemmatimonadota bacterium]
MPKVNPAGRKIFFSDYTWDELDKLNDKNNLKLILPFGAIEAHGYHIPVKSDAFQAEKIAELAALRVSDAIILPAVNYGHCVFTRNYCGTIHVSAQTVISLIGDIAESLHQHGFRKLVVFNGHGGNKAAIETALREAFKNLSSDTGSQNEDFKVYQVNAYQKSADKFATILQGKDYGHACEIETSVMLALEPELVKMERAVEEYIEGDPDIIWQIKDMKKESASATHGAPVYATPEKGQKVLEWLIEELTDFLKKI